MVIEIKIEKEPIMNPSTQSQDKPNKGGTIEFQVERLSPRAPQRRIVTPVVDNSMPDTAVSHALAENFPWTAESIADEFGMPLPSFRAWKQKMEKAGKISKPAVKSLFCIPDPTTAKKRLRYSDAYVDKLRTLRGDTQPRRKEVAPSALQHAKIKILVPVFDENVAKFLVKKFGDERGIEQYLRDHLTDLAKPALNAIEELKKKFEREMSELLGASI